MKYRLAKIKNVTKKTVRFVVCTVTESHAFQLLMIISTDPFARFAAGQNRLL